MTDRMTLKELRLAKCQKCGHEGVVPKVAPTTARLRCRACGQAMQLRHAVGLRPCLLKANNGKRAMQNKRAAEVAQRYSPLPEGGDGLDDI
ncbi:MAG: hypothetical protein KIT48_12025 [Pseudolabrys sp.]|nr:hypothetical protein [Pseudolabrys sp.]